MFKKIGSFLGALTLSIVSCNALKMEILDGNFSFIIDTQKQTAKIRWIYISAYTKEEIVIPKYVKDYHGDEYLVDEIQEEAMKQAVPRMKSFVAREAFFNNEKNFAALRWLTIHNIPFASISKSVDLDFSDFSED